MEALEMSESLEMGETESRATRATGLAAFDSALLCAVGRIESVLLTRLMRGLTRMGDAESWVLAILVLAAAGAGETAALLATGAGGASLVSQVLKRLARRPRPGAAGISGFSPRIDVPDEFSFPSGHTSAAFGVAVSLAGTPDGLGLFALALASGIGASRIYLGAHYPLDVAAGVIVGSASGLAAQLLVGHSTLLLALGYSLAS